MTATGQPAWNFDPEDRSVGLFGYAWEHDACPVADGPEEGVEEHVLAVVRVDNLTVRTWAMLTCQDCAAQHVLWWCEPDPSDEYLAEMDAAQDAWQAQYDNDPSPYAGTYSEE